MNTAFLKHFTQGSPDECWEWQSGLDINGYGKNNRGKAHRQSYQYFVGSIPQGYVINHLCENRKCVNWHHLKAVTIRENIQYSAYKKQGSKSYHSSINEEKAKEIYNLLEESNLSYIDIARKCKVTKNIIHNIKNGRTWNHITGYDKKLYTRNYNITKNDRNKIFKKIDMPDNEVECWQWTGSINSQGYGYYKASMIHRVIYEMLVGSIAEGMVINHRCENRTCVSPHHLECVTQSDNVKHSIDRNRGTKVKTDRREELQELLKDPNITIEDIAEKFDVHPGTIQTYSSRYGIKEKMREEKRDAIVALLKEGKLSQQEIADQFNITNQRVCTIFKQEFGKDTKYESPHSSRATKKTREDGTIISAKCDRETALKIKNTEGMGKDIAKQFGVSASTVSKIRRGLSPYNNL